MQANACKRRKLLQPDDGTTQQPASKVNVEPINAESSKPPQKYPSSARQTLKSSMWGGEEEKKEAQDNQEEPESSFDRLKDFLLSTGQRREQVKYTNPVLWQEFVKDNMPFHTSLRSCVFCADPNAETQRLNAMVICAPCIRFVLQILEQKDQK